MMFKIPNAGEKEEPVTYDRLLLLALN